MKIAVEKIGNEEVRREEDVPSAAWGMDSFDLKFINSIHLDCGFIRAGKDVSVKVKVTTQRMITCSRCLKKVEQSVSQKFKLHYHPGNLGEYLEVDKDVREEILLNFPMKLLCSPDCRGICANCGVNLNDRECQCQKSKTKAQKQKINI